MFKSRALSALSTLLLLPLIIVGATISEGCAQDDAVAQATAEDGLYAVFETTMGPIVCQLFYDKVPVTVGNFVNLATGAKEWKDPATGEMVQRPFYDGLKFHRVIKDFMIQGGCPLGTGTGGPGYSFMDEFDSSLRHDKPGILSMANSGPATNGSQFFITHKPTPWLDDKHSIFGRTVLGQDVVDAMATVPMTGAQNSSPVEDIVLTKLSIVRTGAAAEKFDAIAAFAKAEEIAAQKERERKELEATQRVELAETLGIDLNALTKSSEGLEYIVLQEGTGDSPVKGQTATAHYDGYLLDGKKFDSSRDKGQPYPAKVGMPGVIQGWDLTLQDMKVGERRIVFIPGELGYGARGYPGVIPPNATLVFDLELLEVQ